MTDVQVHQQWRGLLSMSAMRWRISLETRASHLTGSETWQGGTDHAFYDKPLYPGGVCVAPPRRCQAARQNRQRQSSNGLQCGTSPAPMPAPERPTKTRVHVPVEEHYPDNAPHTPGHTTVHYAERYEQP